MDYFRLYSDETDVNQWWLGAPLRSDGAQVDVWQFVTGRRYGGPEPLLIPLVQDGAERDVVFGEFDVPYASEKAASIFKRLAPDDVQCIPAITTDGRPVYLPNALRVIDCLDDEASRLTHDSSGRVNMVLELRIDPRRVGHHDVFRIERWKTPFIVSGRVLEALAKGRATGFTAIKVSG